MNTTTEPVRSNVSRRNILIGAAWAAPAIMIATALPAAAASATPPAFGTPVVTKKPANAYDVMFTVTAGGASALTTLQATITGNPQNKNFDVAVPFGWVEILPRAVTTPPRRTFLYSGSVPASSTLTTTIPVTQASKLLTLSISAYSGSDPVGATFTL